MRELVQVKQIYYDVQTYSKFTNDYLILRICTPEIIESIQNVILHFPENDVIVENHSDPENSWEIVNVQYHFRLASVTMIVDCKYSYVCDKSC